MKEVIITDPVTPVGSLSALLSCVFAENKNINPSIYLSILGRAHSIEN